MPDYWEVYQMPEHKLLGRVPDNVPDKHVLRDYKDYIYNVVPGAAQGDWMVSPAGEVWLIEFWDFKSIQNSGRDKPKPYTEEDVRRLAGQHRLPAVHVHQKRENLGPAFERKRRMAAAEIEQKYFGRRI